MPISRLLKTLLVLVFVLVPMLYLSCDLRVSAMGYQNRIFIFADSLLWSEIGEEVSAVFEKEISMPVIEYSFYVSHEPLQKLGGFKDRMNVFFVGVADEDNPTNNYIEQSIPDTLLRQMVNNEIFYFFVPDMFADHQIGGFFFSKDRESFKKNLELLKDDIYREFKKRYFKRLKEEVYAIGEQENVSELIASTHGWKVRVQHDYFIATQNVDEKYVWLRRIQPDRWLSVWRVEGDSSLVNRDSLIRIRNRMTAKYYEGDTVEEADTFLEEAELNTYDATKMIGLWRNDSLTVGGPFRMYAVYDNQQKALYCIDLAVMAPDRRKKPFIDQLEVIANTFEIVRD